MKSNGLKLLTLWKMFVVLMWQWSIFITSQIYQLNIHILFILGNVKLCMFKTEFLLFDSEEIATLRKSDPVTYS